MRLLAKNAFIGAAERARAALDIPHKPEGRAALPLSRTPAHRTAHADVGHGLVESGRFIGAHVVGGPIFARTPIESQRATRTLSGRSAPSVGGAAVAGVMMTGFVMMMTVVRAWQFNGPGRGYAGSGRLTGKANSFQQIEREGGSLAKWCLSDSKAATNPENTIIAKIQH